MPSVKWAIAIEKNNTATDRKPRFLFRVLPGVLPKNGRRIRTQRGPLTPKPPSFTRQETGKWGGRYSHLEAVLQAYVAAP